MNIKKYFWNLNLKAIRETEKIFKDPKHPKFIERMVTLLSRCDNPKEIFLLTGEKQFVDNWPRIRKYWIMKGEAQDFRSWWETVYEQLLDQKEIKKQPEGAPSEMFIRIGRIIRENRINKGLNQTDLAHRARIKQPDISKIESGKINLTLETLLRICKILDIKGLPLK